VAPTGLFWAWCVDSMSRANIAILDCTNTLAPAQRLGRHFQGVFASELPRAEALGYDL